MSEYWWNDSRNPATNPAKEYDPYLESLDWDIDQLHLSYYDEYGQYKEDAIDLIKIVDFNEDFDNLEVTDWDGNFECTIRVYLSSGNYKDYFVNNLYELL